MNSKSVLLLLLKINVRVLLFWGKRKHKAGHLRSLVMPVQLGSLVAYFGPWIFQRFLSCSRCWRSATLSELAAASFNVRAPVDSTLIRSRPGRVRETVPAAPRNWDIMTSHTLGVFTPHGPETTSRVMQDVGSWEYEWEQSERVSSSCYERFPVQQLSHSWS